MPEESIPAIDDDLIACDAEDLSPEEAAVLDLIAHLNHCMFVGIIPEQLAALALIAGDRLDVDADAIRAEFNRMAICPAPSADLPFH